jgi:hypothetical protein
MEDLHPAPALLHGFVCRQRQGQQKCAVHFCFYFMRHALIEYEQLPGNQLHRAVGKPQTNAARVVLQILTDFVPRIAYPLVGYTGFIEFTALAWWGFELWRTMNRAKTNRSRVLATPFPMAAR